MLHVSSVREMQITTAMKLSVHLLGAVCVKRTEQVWGGVEKKGPCMVMEGKQVGKSTVKNA